MSFLQVWKILQKISNESDLGKKVYISTFQPATTKFDEKLEKLSGSSKLFQLGCRQKSIPKGDVRAI